MNPERLAPREREVLALLLVGYTNSEIAERMVISEETVRNYLTKIAAIVRRDHPMPMRTLRFFLARGTWQLLQAAEARITELETTVKRLSEENMSLRTQLWGEGKQA